MSEQPLADGAQARAAKPGPLWREPWDALDDDGLLAYFRARRDICIDQVVGTDGTQPREIDNLAQGGHEFNSAAPELAAPVDWLNDPDVGGERHIPLHKFHYAVGLGLAWQKSGDDRYARHWAALIDGWIRVSPPGFIATDVSGTRVRNWIYSHLLFVAPDSCAPIDAAFHRRLLQSIHDQVEFLCAHLTSKRNRRIFDLHAIFLAGVMFPEMRRAAYWREFGLARTVASMRTDLLADGVHRDLSSDCHHLALRNWMRIRRLAADNGIAVPASMDEALESALDFSLHLHKPDGAVPRISDGDSRGFPDLLADGAALFGRDDMRYVATRGAQGTPTRRRVAHFPASGFSVVRSHWGQNAEEFADAQYLIFDCGPLGDVNHGHFDCLHFELAAFGRSLVVDPGLYTFGEGGDRGDGVNWRAHFRGTAAHNTVCVDGKNQTRYVPKATRGAARHVPGSVRHKVGGPAPEADLLERFHGARLDLLHGRCRSHEYDAVHERCIVFVDRHYWLVSDWLRADDEHVYALNFQLNAHAADQTEFSSGNGPRVRSPGLLVVQSSRAGVRHALFPGWVSASFGDKQAAPAIRSTSVGRNADFDTVLLPWRDQEPDLSLCECAVESDGTDAPALRIALVADGKEVTDTWFHARGAPERTRRIGPFEFEGRWLHVREAADGSVLHAVSHSGALLHETRHGVRTRIVLDAEEDAA